MNSFCFVLGINTFQFVYSVPSSLPLIPGHQHLYPAAKEKQKDFCLRGLHLIFMSSYIRLTGYIHVQIHLFSRFVSLIQVFTTCFLSLRTFLALHRVAKDQGVYSNKGKGRLLTVQSLTNQVSIPAKGDSGVFSNSDELFGTMKPVQNLMNAWDSPQGHA